MRSCYTIKVSIFNLYITINKVIKLCIYRIILLRFVQIRRGKILKYSHNNFEDLVGDCSIKYADTTFAEKFRMHVHDAYEVTLILSEDVELVINDTSYPVPKGSLLLFNTMDAHQIKYNGISSYRRYVVWFKNDFLNEFDTLSHQLLRCFFLRNFEKANLLTLKDVQLEKALELYGKLKDISDGELFMKSERFKLTLAELLIYVNEWYLSKNVDNIPVRNDDYAAVYKAILYIQENFSKNISRKTLSTLTGLTQRTLCDYFKNVTGMTTNQYVLTFRLSVAKSLLLKNIPTAEVAEKTGFDNYSNFSRTFKNHVGLSPKQYAVKFINHSANAEHSY